MLPVSQYCKAPPIASCIAPRAAFTRLCATSCDSVTCNPDAIRYLRCLIRSLTGKNSSAPGEAPSPSALRLPAQAPLPPELSTRPLASSIASNSHKNPTFAQPVQSATCFLVNEFRMYTLQCDASIDRALQLRNRSSLLIRAIAQPLKLSGIFLQHIPSSRDFQPTIKWSTDEVPYVHIDFRFSYWAVCIFLCDSGLHGSASLAILRPHSPAIRSYRRTSAERCRTHLPAYLPRARGSLFH